MKSEFKITVEFDTEKVLSIQTDCLDTDEKIIVIGNQEKHFTNYDVAKNLPSLVSGLLIGMKCQCSCHKTGVNL